MLWPFPPCLLIRRWSNLLLVAIPALALLLSGCSGRRLTKRRRVRSVRSSSKRAVWAGQLSSLDRFGRKRKSLSLSVSAAGSSSAW
jgi:hypothetical protein